MVIEWLEFQVKPEAREKFIQKDQEIWTKFLAKQPGFLGKELWINPDNYQLLKVKEFQVRKFRENFQNNLGSLGT